MRVFNIFVLLLAVLPFSLGTGDGAGPSRPAAAEDPLSIRAASLSSSIAKCESTIAAADRVLMDSSATGEARHAAERARNEANARLAALESQLQQITSSGRHPREPDSTVHQREVEDDTRGADRDHEERSRRNKRPVEDDFQYFGSRYIDRELPKPTQGFQDKFKDGKVHKLRASQHELLSYIFYVLWFILDEIDIDRPEGDNNVPKVGHFPDLPDLKREVEKDYQLSVRQVVIFALRKVYEEAFALCIRHEHGYEAESHFRGDSISGCDKSVGPTKRAEKAIKKAKSDGKAVTTKPVPSVKKTSNKDFSRFRPQNRSQGRMWGGAFFAPQPQMQFGNQMPTQFPVQMRSSQQGGNRLPGPCFKCGQFGHISANCHLSTR